MQDEIAPPPPQGFALSRPAQEGLRGFLIVMIAMGHSTLMTQGVLFVFQCLYFWHVQGFFFLAYGRRDKMADVNLHDRLFRYLVPYAWFAGAMAVLKLAVGPHAPGDVTGSVLALLIGTAAKLDGATYIQLFWFLPTLAGMTIVLVWQARLVRRWPQLALPLGLLVLIWGVGAVLVPKPVLDDLPLGLGLVGYLIVLAEAHRQLLPLAHGSAGATVRRIVWAGVALALAAEIWLIARGETVNIAVFQFSDLNRPLPALIHAMATVAANVLLFSMAGRMTGSSWLRWLGARSMDIYLLHQFALYPLTLAVRHLVPHRSGPLDLAMGIVLALIAVGAAAVGSLVADRIPHLRPLIFPPRWLGRIKG